MSEYKCPVTRIKEIKPHSNSDNLEFAVCYDFHVIVRKNTYKVGDLVLYIPIDSILPSWLEEKLFSSDSKIKLNKSRVRQIKIRGQYSQGMIVDLQDAPQLNYHTNQYWLEKDVAEELGIKKYEPPQANYQQPGAKKQKAKENPHFHKYGGIDNFKWYPDLFKEGEIVSVTEKIHGANIRFGYAPYVANNFWRKILKFLKLTPTHEWVYGSNNVQLQQKINKTGYYGVDVYGKVLEKYDAKNKCKPGEIWYGELYGDGIQKNYNYGLENEHGLVVFDCKFEDIYVNAQMFQNLAQNRGFETVPELYYGPYDKDKIMELTKGSSIFRSEQKIREGIVIKPAIESQCQIGRKLLKVISEKYLESDQSEFH